MKKKHIVLTSILIGFSIFVVSCGPKVEPTPTVDAVALMTDVAMTVEAEVAQAALLTPSPTTPVLPTPTIPMVATQDPAAASALTGPTITVPVVTSAATIAAPTGDDSAWVEDVTVKNGDVFYKGEYLKVIWKVKNTGTTTWDSSYALFNWDGNTWGEESVVPLTEVVPPGTEVNLSLTMRAPDSLGDHMSRWFLMNSSSQKFGEELYVYIVVGTFDDKTPTPAG